MTKKKDPAQKRSPRPIDPRTKADWCRPLQISEKQAADISVYAQRHAMTPVAFIVYACRTLNDQFLAQRSRRASRSLPPLHTNPASPPDPAPYERDGDPDTS